jgi:hypothetical protein
MWCIKQPEPLYDNSCRDRHGLVKKKNILALLLYQQQPCAEVKFFFVIMKQQPNTKFRFKLLESSYRNVQNA